MPLKGKQTSIEVFYPASAWDNLVMTSGAEKSKTVFSLYFILYAIKKKIEEKTKSNRERVKKMNFSLYRKHKSPPGDWRQVWRAARPF